MLQARRHGMDRLPPTGEAVGKVATSAGGAGVICWASWQERATGITGDGQSRRHNPRPTAPPEAQSERSNPAAPSSGSNPTIESHGFEPRGGEHLHPTSTLAPCTAAGSHRRRHPRDARIVLPAPAGTTAAAQHPGSIGKPDPSCRPPSPPPTRKMVHPCRSPAASPARSGPTTAKPPADQSAARPHPRDRQPAARGVLQPVRRRLTSPRRLDRRTTARPRLPRNSFSPPSAANGCVLGIFPARGWSGPLGPDSRQAAVLTLLRAC